MDACNSPENTPKFSKLTLIVGRETAGSWRCSVTKKGDGGQMWSEKVTVTEQTLNGTQTPESVWGIVGANASITCVVPSGLTLTNLQEVWWTLDGNRIRENVGFTKNNDVVLFTVKDEMSTATVRKSVISFTHTLVAVGTVQCQATYSPERAITIPSTHIDVITVKSNVEFIIMTPTSRAEVNFTTTSNSTPTTLVEMPAGSARSLTTKEVRIPDRHGIIFSEVITFSSSVSAQTNMKDLFRKIFSFNYTINPGSPSSIGLPGQIILVGQTYIESTVWASIGQKTTITAHLTAAETTNISVVWQQKNTENNQWEDIDSDGYSSILSQMDDKGVVTAILIIDKTKHSDITEYRAQIHIATFSETTDVVELQAVNFTINEVPPVFEKESVLFSAMIKGPSKPSSVLLVQEESGKETEVTLSEDPSSSPFEITHNMTELYYSQQGSYRFKAIYESGLEYKTRQVLLLVLQRCKPLTRPPNTELKKENIPHSNNYKVTVTCTSESFVMMDESLKEAICDTSTGTYDKSSLTPCLKTIDPIVD